MKRLYVVGLGPGSEQGMTGAALAALTEAEVLCGYTKYIELVDHLFPEKKTLSTGMKREVERCHAALQIADFLCYDVVRRVLQTGIEISLLLQIEQFSHFLAGCIFECCALVNRKYTRLTVFRLPSSLYTDCVLAVSHNFSPFCK